MGIDLKMSGGTVVTPAGSIAADVLVTEGKIVGLVGADVPVTA
ncbi:MAG: hypothetical protein QOI28_5280, partial [Mycobacterium sp.]|nr:hypothetical protein [Mycobacterium sp.]